MSTRKAIMWGGVVVAIFVVCCVFGSMVVRDAGRKRRACLMLTAYPIELAKGQAVLKYGLTNGQIVSTAQVCEFTPWPAIPKCPSGGTISINPVGSNVTCSVHGFMPL